MIPNGHPKKLQKLYHTIICSHCCPRCPFIFLEPVQENGNRHLREASKSFRKSQRLWGIYLKCLFNIPRACAGKWYLTDTSKKGPKSIFVFENRSVCLGLPDCPFQIPWACAGKRYLTDTSERLQFFLEKICLEVSVKKTNEPVGENDT